MAAAKKAVTKQPATRRRRKADVADDGIYWVISKRELVTWKPFSLYKTEELARAAAATFESQSNTSYRKYKVDRVLLRDPTVPAA